jgi:hypothetical protein
MHERHGVLGVLGTHTNHPRMRSCLPAHWQPAHTPDNLETLHDVERIRLSTLREWDSRLDVALPPETNNRLHTDVRTQMFESLHKPLYIGTILFPPANIRLASWTHKCLGLYAGKTHGAVGSYHHAQGSSSIESFDAPG